MRTMTFAAAVTGAAAGAERERERTAAVSLRRLPDSAA